MLYQVECCCLSLHSFTVKQTTGKGEAGALVQVSLPLAVKPLLKSPSYNLTSEDPTVYSDEEDFDVGFMLQCEWPDIPLPSKSKEEEETFKYLEEAQRAHDFHVALLATHGTDACKVHRMGKATAVLEGITKEDWICFICQKELPGSQSL